MLRRRIGDMFRAVANLIDPPRLIRITSTFPVYMDGNLMYDPALKVTYTVKDRP